MHSAFNLLVFPNSMFTSLLFALFFNERAMCSPEKYHLKIPIIIIIIIKRAASVDRVRHSVFGDGSLSKHEKRTFISYLPYICTHKTTFIPPKSLRKLRVALYNENKKRILNLVVLCQRKPGLPFS